MGDNIKPNVHNSLKKINIVHAIGTDAGKTYATCSLIRSFQKIKKIFAIKPIITGLTEKNFQECDNFKLLQAMGFKNPTFDEVCQLSCYWFKEPLSPDIASWKEGVEIDFEKVINFCKSHINKQFDHLFIETAGGVCSPISNFHTMRDISKSLQEFEPLNILVVNDYLGAISHTLSALECLNFGLVIFNRCSVEFVQSIKNHGSLPECIYL